MSLSATLANTRLSLADGYAFVDFSAADVLTANIGKKITILDAAGKKAIGYIKSAGTAEQLDGEIATSWTNYVTTPYDTFSSTGGDNFAAVKTGGGWSASYIPSVTSSGGLYKVIADYVKNSGTMVRCFATQPSISSGTPVITYAANPASGAIAAYAMEPAGTRIMQTLTNLVCDIAATNFSYKQVIAPSATGVTIVSSHNGATYDWESIETGFVYNSATGYTYYIEDVAEGGAAAVHRHLTARSFRYRLRRR